jgi:F-type H+-transporting ATPase subunit b
MPQFDPTTFLSQLFWLAVTFAVLFYVMWRHALPRLSNIMAARQQRIGADLEKAASVKEEADQVLAEYERSLAEARDQAAAAIKQAGDEMAAESAGRHESFGTELAGQAREAEQRIAAARDEALANIKIVAADAASAATAKLIGLEAPAEQVRNAVDAAARSRS